MAIGYENTNRENEMQMTDLGKLNEAANLVADKKPQPAFTPSYDSNVTKTEPKKRGPGRPRKYPKKPKSTRGPGRPRKPKTINTITLPSPQRQLSYTQRVLRGMFNDKNQMWNNGENPVQINETLTSGSGLIKNGNRGETARMFGGWRR